MFLLKFKIKNFKDFFLIEKHKFEFLPIIERERERERERESLFLDRFFIWADNFESNHFYLNQYRNNNKVSVFN